ncbi:MAG: hypothetical protein QFB87_03095 [Patescibacteria group bacterium]|nr:hypothetical protein [Patescibacteria group bacterium]
MAIICPTVTAFNEHDYKEQLLRLRPFAKHIHIDLMDGHLAPTVSPGLDHIWWPPEFTVDIHLMYQEPMTALDDLIRLRPRMVIVHNEAHVHHMHFAGELHKAGIQTGLALLQATPVAYAEQIMHSFDQVLIFSGNLGHHGGSANLELLAKAKEIRQHHPDVEIAWDGGITDQNVAQLVAGGVEILNVGGYIQNSGDPASAYAKLEAVLRS